MIGCNAKLATSFNCTRKAASQIWQATDARPKNESFSKSDFSTTHLQHEIWIEIHSPWLMTRQKPTFAKYIGLFWQKMTPDLTILIFYFQLVPFDTDELVSTYIPTNSKTISTIMFMILKLQLQWIRKSFSNPNTISSSTNHYFVRREWKSCRVTCFVHKVKQKRENWIEDDKNA